MRRHVAKIEDERRKGNPLPFRPIHEKSAVDVQRIFSIRAVVTVREHGVRYRYLEWVCDAFKDREGHRVELFIPPADVSEIWAFDLDDKVWIKPTVLAVLHGRTSVDRAYVCSRPNP